jgi:hypothetical protein
MPCETGRVFAVVITGGPGAGKTTALIALSDALADDRVAHGAVDVDEVAWAYPYPDLDGRCAYLRSACEAHRRAGLELLLVSEVIESPAHRGDVLAAIGADDHLLVRLDAEPATMRERIVAREPEGWSGLEMLLAETETLARLDDVHLALDAERLDPREIAERIRAAF